MNRRAFFRRTLGALATAAVAPAVPASAHDFAADFFANGVLTANEVRARESIVALTPVSEELLRDAALEGDKLWSRLTAAAAGHAEDEAWMELAE